jgi:hypothetical protein
MDTPTTRRAQIMSPSNGYDATPAPAAPAPQQGGGYDTTPQGGYDAAPAPQQQGATPPPPTYMQNVHSRLTGLGEGLSDLMLPADVLMHKTPGIGEFLAPQAMIEREQARAAGTAPGVNEEQAGGRQVGHELGNMALWETGDKLLLAAGGRAAAALDLPSKLQELGRIGKIVKDYPGILTGLRHAAVQTGLSLSQGASLPEALKAGAATGVLSGAIDTTSTAGTAGKAAGAIEEAKPTTRTVEGVQIPEFRDQSGTGRPGVITRTTDPDIAKQQQAGAQQAFRNTANRATQKALDRFATTADPVTSFGQGSKQIIDKMSGVYDQLNQETGGAFRKVNQQLSDAKDDLFKASGKDRIAAQKQVDSLKTQMDSMFEGFNDANYEQGLRSAAQNARAGFHDAFDLDTIHRYVNKAWNMPSEQTAQTSNTPYTLNEAPGPKGQPQPPTVRRASLGNQLKTMEDKMGTDRLTELLGPEGLGNLHQQAQLTDNPANADAAKSLMREVAGRMITKGGAYATMGGLLGHFMGYHWPEGAGAGFVAGAAHGATEVAANKLLHYAATSPRIGAMLNYAVKHNIGAKYAAPLIAAGVSQEYNPNPDEQPAQQQPQEQDQAQRLTDTTGKGTPAQGAERNMPMLREFEKVPMHLPADVMTRPLSPDLENRVHDQSTEPPLRNTLKAKAWLAQRAVRGGNPNSEENQSKAAGMLGGR